MLVSVERLLDSLSAEIARRCMDTAAEGSSDQSISGALQLLRARERGGPELVRDQLRSLKEMLRGNEAIFSGNSGIGVGAFSLDNILGSIDDALQKDCLPQLEQSWSALLAQVEQLLMAYADRTDPNVSGVDARSEELLRTLGRWEIEYRQSIAGPRLSRSTRDNLEITVHRLCAYLQARFDDPSIEVTTLQTLPGGFGKQTYLFSATGAAFSGDYVLRRDWAEPLIDNDCHRIRKEAPVIQAVHARGFPAPEVRWLDTEHPLLPGGDFIVMRRGSGAVGGHVFGATSELSTLMPQLLATALAQLHGLPSMPELDGLTESIGLRMWSLPLRDCVESYIHRWYDLYRSSPHCASPLSLRLYDWLFRNIPHCPGQPALLHGDVGFHNMLVHKGQLSLLVDWEYAHLGDPAEDLGYVRNTSQGMNWQQFVDSYTAAGGAVISPDRLHFFQVWGHVRNATACNLSTYKFVSGGITDLKVAYTGHFHLLHFLDAACKLIDSGPGDVAPRPGIDYANMDRGVSSR